MTKTAILHAITTRPAYSPRSSSWPSSCVRRVPISPRIDASKRCLSSIASARSTVWTRPSSGSKVGSIRSRLDPLETLQSAFSHCKRGLPLLHSTGLCSRPQLGKHSRSPILIRTVNPLPSSLAAQNQYETEKNAALKDSGGTSIAHPRGIEAASFDVHACVTPEGV